MCWFGSSQVAQYLLVIIKVYILSFVAGLPKD